MYAKLRLPPHIRSFSRCSFRQTATLAGPNDRIEPNYFLYRDVNFFGRKKVVFRGFRLRLPPHFRVFPSGWRGQTMGMRGSGDRIEPIYFQHNFGPGNPVSRQPAASPRGNGFPVLRIF